MKLLTQLLLAAGAIHAAAFAPSTTMLQPAHHQTVMSMGLFDGVMDYFSDEAKAKREEEKQRMIEEQEEAYREVLARRRNPEMMDEYMEQRKERLSKFKESTVDDEEE